MTTSTGRSPPILAPVRCPFCDRLWFKFEPAGSTERVEISCPGARCRRLILFRLINGRPIVERYYERRPIAWPDPTE